MKEIIEMKTYIERSLIYTKWNTKFSYRKEVENV